MVTIVVRITGGLGNQLFQYAMGRALAVKHGTDLLLEDSFYFDVPPGSTPRTYELDNYPIQGRRTTGQERKAFGRYTGRVWRRIRKYVRLPGAFSYVCEPMQGGLSNFETLGDNVFLDGYWQTERYFSGIADVIHKEFTPLLPPSAQDHAILLQMQESPSVSLHVRRGDYVTNPSAQAMHGLCSLEYYGTAIRHAAERLGNPKFFIFSDDPEWVRENLEIPFDHVFIDHNAAAAWQDLRLMSSCKHHILANSSFSWWGAWLNKSSDKIVIRPRQWYVGLPEQGDWTCPPQWLAV